MKSTKTQQKATGVGAASNKRPEGRWFKVTSERFDWRPKRTVIITWKGGSIGYGTKACIEDGLARNQIELIKKPPNASVTKEGKVVFK